MSLLAVAPAAAQKTGRDTVELTFSGPVQVPGKTLAAGDYVFTIADRDAMRSVIQIWNGDRTQLIAQPIVVPVRRPEPASGELTVMFGATPEGVAPAVRAWFVPGDLHGHEFVYPERQARWIATATKTVVLSGQDDMSNLEGLPDVPFYRVDAYGYHYPYVDPAEWTAAPMLDQPLPVSSPAAAADLLDELDMLIAEALAQDGLTEVTVSRAELQQMQADLARLREAIMDAPGGHRRH